MADEKGEEIKPIKPEEHRQLWQGTVVTPAGSAFRVKKCDLIEFLLLFISEKEVEEIMAMQLDKRIEQIKNLRAQGKEDEIMRKLCLQNVLEPKIVYDEAGPGELSYQELHPMERRYIMNYALSLPRFFRGHRPKQSRKPRRRDRPKVREAAK